VTLCGAYILLSERRWRLHNNCFYTLDVDFPSVSRQLVYYTHVHISLTTVVILLIFECLVHTQSVLRHKFAMATVVI